MSDSKSPVILCTCGEQISLDYDKLASATDDLDLTSSTIIHHQLCQEDGLAQIAELIETEEGRLVIAACTKQKIQSRIDQYLRSRNLNPSRIQYVNLREHSAWVHESSEKATAKTLDMIRGSVVASSLSNSFQIESKDIANHVMVIGGGIAGIESALSLSNLGYRVSLIERNDKLGGHVANLPLVAPTGKTGQEILSGRIEAVTKDKDIEILLNTQVKYVQGEMGGFKAHIVSDGDESDIETSAIILAMGFKEFKPDKMEEYQYSKNPDVITQYELSQLLTEDNLSRPSDGQSIDEVIMVQCVGSRSEDYKHDCSKLCCTFAIDNAIEILKRNPETTIKIVYMDIRVPFENEMIYAESREMGVDFVRGRISQIWMDKNGTHVKFYDSLLDQYFQSNPDLVVLSSAILAPDHVAELSESLGYELESEGHVKELYGKLRRNETRRRGVVAVGAITRPQFVNEAITEAQAGALVIHQELRGGTIEKIARGAVLDVDDCVGCSLCAQHCPRGVPLMIEQSETEEETEGDKLLFKAAIDTLNCHACGVCQSLCPSAATQLNFLTNEQLWAKIQSTLQNADSETPITLCYYCDECAVSTIDIVGTRKMKYSPDTRLISVPCAGRISIIDILKAFESGASTVMIASCETDRCHIGGTGNEIAQVQVDVARDILNAIGWDGNRVEMFRMFSAEPRRFTEAIAEMTKRAKELGPTPVHKGTAGKWMEAEQ